MQHFVRLALLAVSLGFAATASAEELVIPKGGYVVSSNLDLLPEPVRKKRDQLLAIAKTGDIEAFGPILDTDQTNVSFGAPEDKLAYLKKESGDSEGIEMLAFLAEILEAPYVATEGGDGKPFYAWPYFAGLDDLSVLTPEQLVDAYKILGHDGFEEQRDFGGWIWWRAYIGADGKLTAFVAGD